MRPAAACICTVFILLLTGCGYVGPVQPPSPEIPTAITDLSAVERGDKIVITFTTPPRTTDGVAVTRFSHIDLRIGPETQPPDSDPLLEIEPPAPNAKEDPQPQPIAYSVDVSSWKGQRIAVSVRTAMKKNGHFSAWSNKAVLSVFPTLARPVVKAVGSAAGVVLTWPSSDATEYLVQRQSSADKQPVEIASVSENKYTDVSALYDTSYQYTVTARKESAESQPSEPVVFSYPDIYPPANPTGLTALVGPDAINLAWQRNSEPDLQGYYIYRSVNNGPFERMGGLATLPTYADHNVEHGKTYSYKVSAVDKKNNPSGPSAPAEVTF